MAWHGDPPILQQRLEQPLEGRTVGILNRLGSLSQGQRDCLFFETCGGELRIVFHGEDDPQVETRENSNTRCVTVVLGQFENTTTSIGIGNPSCTPFGRLLASSRSRELAVVSHHSHTFTLLNLILIPFLFLYIFFTQRTSSKLGFWLTFDIFGSSPLIALGVHKNGRRSPADLLYRLSVEEASLLQHCRHISVTNWREPVTYALLSVSSVVSQGVSILNLPSSKFHDNGSPRLFPGCTWVSTLDRKTWLFKALKEAQRILREEFPRLGRHYAFLPPESFHMTVLDGLSPHNGINLDENLSVWEASIEEVVQKVKRSTIDLKPPPIRLRFKGFSDTLTTSLFEDNFDDLRQWCRKVSEVTGIPVRDGYEFHITIAYLQWPLGRSVELIRDLAEARVRITSVLSGVGESPLDLPRLCRFNDMFGFHPTD
jgi:hypothetical protein